MSTREEISQRPGAEQLYRVVTGSDPGAGQEITVTVPGGSVWELLSLRADLTTDATVPPRQPHIVLDDGERELFRCAAALGQADSDTRGYCFYSGAWDSAPNADLVPALLPQAPYPLYPGFRIRTVTNALAAGDNWTAPVLYVYEYTARSLASQIAYEVRMQMEELTELDRYSAVGSPE